MSDFPSTLLHPQRLGVSTFGANGLLSYAANGSSNTFQAGAVWPSANRALYIPVWIPVACVAQKMAFQVVTQSGNCDVGIYDEFRNRVVSKGSTAVGAAGLQVIDIADTALSPGTYFLAMCVDNVTASFIRSTTPALLCQISGVQQQAVGAVTLPNPATFANPSSAYVPALNVSLVATL